MNVKNLISKIKPIEIVESESAETIIGITSDSRTVAPGTAFFAIRGGQIDGHDFIAAAVDAGAKAVVAEHLPKEMSKTCTYLRVADAREALGLAAAAFYGEPSRQMKVVGVTGTNGKTTVATLLFRLFRASGHRVGLLSTVCNCINEEEIPATHTTPDPVSLQFLLARMRDAGCAYVFMEVSSHAADQKRIAGIDFSGGLFTNLTRDHLDYHGTVPAYIRAKKLFFDALRPDAFALINADDKNGAVMLQNCRAKKYSYALRSPADFNARILEEYPDSTDVLINGKALTLRLVGAFNTYNALAVFAAARLLGEDETELLRCLSTLTAVDGRFQTFRSPLKGYTAVVDYAHTPDALANVLDTINHLRIPPGRIIAVVGAGGDRDHGKRPLMASESMKRADIVILTSDNPRSEEPGKIIADMRAGITDPAARVLAITDRAEAIRAACMMASSGDFVLIAGKGHETYQEIKGIRHHFDDREQVCNIIQLETDNR